MIEDAQKLVKKSDAKLDKLEGKGNQLNHHKKLFLVNLTTHHPEDFAISKYHLINEIKKAAHQENNELTRVATYEQFLSECGDMNKELIELVELKNTLNMLRNDRGDNGADIPLQKFKSGKDTVLNEEVMSEYNRLIHNHNAGVFSREKFETKFEKTMVIDKKMSKVPQNKQENVDILKDIRDLAKANAKRKFDQVQKPFENEKRLFEAHRDRLNVIQPMAQYLPQTVNEDIVDADNIELEFKQDVILRQKIAEIQNVMDKKQHIKEMKMNNVISKARLEHKMPLPTGLIEDSGSSNIDQSNKNTEPHQMKEISADQVWNNWEKFEESIQPEQTPSLTFNSAKKFEMDLENENFLED